MMTFAESMDLKPIQICKQTALDKPSTYAHLAARGRRRAVDDDAVDGGGGAVVHLCPR